MRITLAVTLVATVIALAGCGSAIAAAPSSPAPALTTTASSAVPAGADEPPGRSARWCAAGNLNIHIDEGHSPTTANRLFVVHLAARAGVRCVIGGALGDFTFRDDGGTPLPVDISHNDVNHPRITVHGNAEAVAYVKTGPTSGSIPAASVSFVLPGRSGPSAGVSVIWPAPVDGPVEITNLMSPVS
ncbi:hypothetical protein [Kutzneria sp. CA-103260]|uniref:hypothetical protein n=1 Tax=Kutzneria sp. CA-103260 TaxID=2802641 RepID=UPI001BAA2723|nr:hypothetical protein [Kutzneria sp. CA-103260]QUQ63748.1 hypothetical protein JJ691_14610 [Kutzneria sp. CA-103260]